MPRCFSGPFDIPSSVTHVVAEAFYNCASLTAIYVDPANQHYASTSGVLLNKARTELITCPGAYSGPFNIPGSVTNIGRCAFYNCSGLSSVNIGSSVTNIGSYAFFGCTSLTSAAIPDSVTSIGFSTFSGCSSLTTVTIGSGVISTTPPSPTAPPSHPSSSPATPRYLAKAMPSLGLPTRS